jgi:serine/threonine-protein kinase
VSPELEDVVLRALQKDPARRFADADEFTAALEAVRDLPARPDVAQRTGDLTGVYPPLAVYEEELDHGRGWRFWTTLVLVLLALAAIALGLYLLLRPNEVDVPRVVGQRSEVASTLLNNKGFEVSLQQVPSQDVPEGIVTRQRPDPGVQADEGSTVTIFVSSGPGQADVPDVVDLTVKQARRALTKAGFKSEVELEFSETVKKGVVIDTRPQARSHIDIGQSVTLIVSKGPEQAEVPSVVGLDGTEATARLQDAGFEVATRRQESTSVDPGKVIAQDPAGGQTLRKGETVTLTLAKKPPDVRVPDVRGQAFPDARQALRAAGFQVAREPQDVTTPDEDGIVLDQDPLSGTLPKGETVTLTVGDFNPDLNPEPDETPTPTPSAAVTETPTP